MNFDTVVLPPLYGPGYQLNVWCDVSSGDTVVESLASADAWLWYRENPSHLPSSEDEGYAALVEAYRARLKNMSCSNYRSKALARVTESLEEANLLLPFVALLRNHFGDECASDD